MTLTAFLLLLSAAFYWAGFRAAPHPLQYRSQAPVPGRIRTDLGLGELRRLLRMA
jgi:hypothetical protein